MFSSSGRGQTEPIAALLAVAVIAAGLALYAGVLDDALDVEPNRDVAAATLERVEAHLTPTGVVRPARLPSATDVTPAGYRTNVTVVANGTRTSLGPAPPSTGESAARTVSVRTGPATVDRGRLRVVVW